MIDSWIEIFKAGTHTAKDGIIRTWNENDIDDMIKSFNPQDRQVPVVLGHPKDDAPAYGWVEQLKRQGSVLLAKFKQLDPGFIEMVRSGRFKNRSISLFPGNKLKHVGFLGAVQPAVAGLKDIDFSSNFTCYEFEIANDLDVECYSIGDGELFYPNLTKHV